MSAAPAVASARRAPPGRTLGLGAVAVGAFLAAFPPFSWWPFALVALVPLTHLALTASTPRRAFGRLYLAGFMLFLLGSAWLAETTWLNVLIVAAVEALFVAAYGWAARRAVPAHGAWVLPFLWTGLETLRAWGPLSGYPWQLLGQALAASPVLVQAADLGGVALLSFVAGSGAALALGLWRGERRGPAVAAGVLLAALVYGLVRPSTLSEPRPGPVLATIQPGFGQRLKEDNAAAEERYARSMELSLAALTEGPRVDLLVWPETSWPYALAEGLDVPPRDGERLLARSPFVRDLGPLLADGPLGERAAALLLGTVYEWKDEGGTIRTANTALYLRPDGTRAGRYDKSILVPGGESIPFGRWLPAGVHAAVEDWIRAVAGFVVDLVPGAGPSVLPLGDLRFGVTICFENAYGDYGRRTVKGGAAFLVNLSNEAWFGTSTEFDHMELQSILRAVETRRALVRCTYSGISCLVRPDGRAPSGADRLVVDGRDRAVAGRFETVVPLHDDATLYVLVGDAWGWLCLLVGALATRSRRGARLS